MEVLGVPSDLGTCHVPTPALLGAATSSTRGNASCDGVLPWWSVWWHCSEIICLYLKVFINVNGKPVEKQVLYLQLALKKDKPSPSALGTFGVVGVRTV